MKKRNFPNDRLGWSNYYAKLYNKHGRDTSEHLAIWYLLLHLAFDN
jgi:hypothetical protein